MRITMDRIAPLLLFLLLIIDTSTAIDTINTTQSIRYGDTILSAHGTYELGFFRPGNSRNRYLGIWYAKISVMTVVWVANRETPLNDSSCVLRLTDQGILVLSNQNGSIVWSSGSSRPATNPTAQLLDSGNLVVKEEGDDNLEKSVWQSFEHPSDTLLPGMKLGRNRITGVDSYITSWKSPDDPSRGNVSEILVPYGYPEILVVDNSIVKHRSGPWNGLRFSGMPQSKPNPKYSVEFVFNEKEIFYRYHLLNSSMPWRVVVAQGGDVQRFTWFNRSMNLEECKNTCLKNCNCTAYSNLEIWDGGSGCLLWFDDLLDVRILVENEPDIYIRMAASEIDNGYGAKIKTKANENKRIILGTVLSTGILFLGLALVFYAWKRHQKKNRKMTGVSGISSNKKHKNKDLGLLFFTMDTLDSATNNFSPNNELGEGGFGHVYKGTLKDGLEIAVKRLLRVRDKASMSSKMKSGI